MNQPTLADLQTVMNAEADDVSAADDVLARITANDAAHTRTTPRRRTLLVAACAVIVMALVSTLIAVLHDAPRAGQRDESATRVAWRTVTAPPFHFSINYPSTWHMARFEEASSFDTAIVFFSNQAMTSPCTTTHLHSGTLVSCQGQAVTHLEPGSFSVEWIDRAGLPGQNPFLQAPGKPTVIGGEPARIYIGPTTECNAIGAENSVVATIRRAHVSHEVFQMDACVNANSNSDQVGLILESLHTVRQG